MYAHPKYFFKLLGQLSTIARSESAEQHQQQHGAAVGAVMSG